MKVSLLCEILVPLEIEARDQMNVTNMNSVTAYNIFIYGEGRETWPGMQYVIAFNDQLIEK